MHKAKATARATARAKVSLIVMHSTHKFSIWLTLCSHSTLHECRAICNDLLKWHLHILSHLFANQSGAWAAFQPFVKRLGQLANIYGPNNANNNSKYSNNNNSVSYVCIFCCYWLCITLNASDNGNVKDALNLLVNTHIHSTYTHTQSSLWLLSVQRAIWNHHNKSEWVLCCTYRHNTSIY